MNNHVVTDVKEREQIATRVSTVGIVGNVVLTVFKLIAGIVANSGAMVSDAIHSASDVFATVVVLLGVQTFMIVAGVIKMIPLTGVTMPFLSYGGSSLLSCMAMMGILCGISGRVREETEEDILSAKD